jgi:omega-6 fatty acid desaturase (delta-12 desaturase)
MTKSVAMQDPASPAAQAARRWRADLGRERRRSTDLRGGLVFGLTALLYVLTFLGMLLLPAPWMRVLLLLAQPVLIGALFVIGHDACHHSLTRTGWLNRLLARLSFLPAWHPYTSWAHAHNTMHHGWTSFKGREPAFPPFTKAEFDRLPLWRRLLERLYRTPPGIGFYYAIDFYLKHLLVPRAEHCPPNRRAFALDRLLVLGFLVGQLAAAYALSGLVPPLILSRPVLTALVVFAPWLSWIWFMGFVSFLQHTHPRMAWYNREDEWTFYHVQLKSTAHVVFPWPVERLLYNIMDHPAHHIDPTIPLYELTESQRELEQTCPEHAVVIRWTPLDYFRTCAACKLYDFERHCWTDFRGVATTPGDLPGLPRFVPATTATEAASPTAAPV